MELFFIEPTEKNPQIDLNHLTGELILSGMSIPENAANLYDGVIMWVHEYIKNPRPTTNFRLNLEYFNTSSSICLAKIVKTLCSVQKSEYTLMMHLYFNIEEFNDMEVEDVKDILGPIIDTIGAPVISVGIKIYGVDKKGDILKESIVLI